MTKEKIDELVAELALNINDYYIVGDASLVIRGIKDTCLDLKICGTEKVLENLKLRYPVKAIEGTEERIFKIGDEIELIVEEKENFECEIVEDYPLENVEKILEQKKQKNYEKQDVANIEKYMQSLKYEISCGAYVLDNGKVLLVKHKSGGHWDFPKGHREEGETKQETAIREVFEETGVKIKIKSDEEYKSTYKPKFHTQKTVIFFEAERICGILKKQESEIIELEWLTYDKALERLTFENSKKLFEKFLMDRNKNVNKNKKM